MYTSSSLFKYKSLLFFAPLLFSFSNSPLHAATTTVNNGFEPANLSGLKCSGNCPTIATSPTASGKYSGNFTLTKQMRTNFRTEATLGDDGVFDFGKEYWLKLDYRYEDWARDSNAEIAPFQMHTRSSDYSSACALGAAISSAPFLMTSSNDEVRFVTYGGKILWRGSIQKKQWLNMTIHFRMSSGSDGFVEAWKNGVKLGRVNGPNTPKSDGCGKPMRTPYFKMGVYKWDWKRTNTGSSRRQIFIDNIKVEEGANSSPAASPAPVVSRSIQTAPQPVASNTTKDLIAHWSMETGTSTSIPDASGNGSTGKLANGAQFITGKGVKFDGVNDILDLGKLNIPSNKVTISAWFLADDLSNCGARDCRIISKATGAGEQDHYFMVSTINVGSQTRLRFRLKTNGVTSTLIANSGAIYNNEWTHVTAVYDGQTMRLYKDGIEVGNRSKQGSITASSGASVWIGNNPPSATSRPWKGYIGDVRVYNYPLTNSEIRGLAQ